VRFHSTLLSGALICAVLTACASSSERSTEPAAQTERAGEPAALQQIDRVSLLAWKESLGPNYPLTVLRADSIATVVEFFKATGAGWREQGDLEQLPMFAGFYRGASLESERGFVEFSHGAGGLLLIRERGKLYSRAASPADIDRFLGFFGVGVVLYPN
jgi:hypothetical protein